MANTTAYVSAAKPKTGGAIWAAPVGTTLPTDTTTSLDALFKCLGYVSEDGLSKGTNIESTDIKDWNGDNVLTIQTSKDGTYKFKLIEYLNEDVQKFIHGSTNVSGALATGLTVIENGKDMEEHALVIDMILRGGTAERVVIPNGKVNEIADITYGGSDAIGYEVTLKCSPDASGNTAYKYIKSA